MSTKFRLRVQYKFCMKSINSLAIISLHILRRPHTVIFDAKTVSVSLVA